MTWEIVVGLIALIGFILTIIKFATAVNGALVQNTCAIQELKTAIETLTTEYKEHSARIEWCEKEIIKIQAINN